MNSHSRSISVVLAGNWRQCSLLVLQFGRTVVKVKLLGVQAGFPGAGVATSRDLRVRGCRECIDRTAAARNLKSLELVSSLYMLDN